MRRVRNREGKDKRKHRKIEAGRKRKLRKRYRKRGTKIEVEK
jgi:hypothetical protein